MAFAIGDLLVSLEVLGIPKDLYSPARLMVEDQRTPIAWGFRTTGNADLPTDWERGDSAYDPGVHDGKSLSSSACEGIS